MSVCPWCGREFLALRSNQKFCNPQCATAADYQVNKDRYKEARRQKRTIYNKTCKECGESYQTTNNLKIFCSNKCKIDNNNSLRPTTKQQLRECPVCKKVFRPMQKTGVGRTYCTPVCRSKAMNSRRRTPSKASYWASTVKRKWGGNWYKALTRDDFTCQICGRKRRPSDPTLDRRYILEVHHRDGSGESKGKNHDLSNLTTLCAECHREFHTKINLIYKDGEYFVSGKIFSLLNIEALKTTS